MNLKYIKLTWEYMTINIKILDKYHNTTGQFHFLIYGTLTLSVLLELCRSAFLWNSLQLQNNRYLWHFLTTTEKRKQIFVTLKHTQILFIVSSQHTNAPLTFYLHRVSHPKSLLFDGHANIPSLVGPYCDPSTWWAL